MDHYVNSVRFAVLGPVRAWRGKRELDLGSPQQRVVLALLLLRRGRPVPLGELLGAVWGEEPPAAAVSVLRTYVSRLRKVLEPGRDRAAGQPRVVVSVGDGYVLRIPDDALDLAVFQRRVARAKRARAAGDVSGAAELLHAALGEWQGAALAGLPGPLAETVRSWLDEEWLTALEARLDVDVQLGRHHEVIAELIPLTGRHPLREQLCRLLMLALYRSGRQAEALAAYRGTRSALVRELGVEPGASLQNLHDRILAADPALMPDPAPAPLRPAYPLRQLRPSVTPVASEPSVVASADGRAGDDTATGGRTADEPASDDGPADRPTDGADRCDPHGTPEGTARPAQLPADLPTFAGRHAELERTEALLPEDGSPPSTVVISAIGGMGGIGKSTLAVHWAHRVADRFPGGQLYINLRGFDPTGSAVTPDDAVRIFLDALGVPPMRIPSGLDAQVALYRSLLARSRLLILLDNARDTEQVRPLLPGSPGCLVIVTSRNRLTGLVAGEGAQPLTLDQMTSAEAHDLLARRLGTDRLAAEPEAADEIIARCGRLPLALAIVAAHACAHPAFPLSAIADEVSDSHGSLDAFAGGDDITTDVRAVFSWSYKALSVPAARLFRLLGLHTGPDISAPAAAALAGLPPREARGILAELTRAHLLTEHFPGRYTLHDLLRVYAAERVRAEETREERDLAVERLLSWYLHTADAAYPHITPNRRRIPLEPLPEGCRPLEFTTHEQALDWCETERPNLVVAVHQADQAGKPGIAWRLPAVLWGFFYLRSHTHDWLDTSRTGLIAARTAGDRQGEAQGLSDTAAALRNAGRLEEAIVHLHRALELCQELGDRKARSTVVANLGDVYLHVGRLGKAVEYIRRGLALDRIEGSAWGEGVALCNLGDAYQRLGRYDDALGCLERALVVLRAGDNRWVEGVALDILGTVHHRLGRYDESVEYYRQALATHRDIGNRWGEGHTLGNLGDVHLDAEEPEAARASWHQALAIFAEFGHPDAEKVRARLARLQDGPADARARGAAPKRTA
ncbi:BTAD domain-containing putative transcriptional regulator [Streptomyces sp. NBRC 110035]|uniref:AfsR/SARP family transcriptional regulator n=1 Tax=Streptomyces sp. NBRC 110035 TaxID=1547867 RepID=UPI0005A92B02|nr:BTAD domain-containing putative transcriptional regulator [Streptomyces sp. NBRC 110035]